MSVYRGSFKIESIGYYPNGKALYLTVSPVTAQEKKTKLSILLDRTDENLKVIGEIVEFQYREVKLFLDTTTRETIASRSGGEQIRYRATEIHIICEPSKLMY